MIPNKCFGRQRGETPYYEELVCNLTLIVSSSQIGENARLNTVPGMLYAGKKAIRRVADIVFPKGTLTKRMVQAPFKTLTEWQYIITYEV